MEHLGQGLLIGALGMGAIFVTLVLLLLMITALRRFVPVEPSLRVPFEEIPPRAEAPEAEDDIEEMAVAAAVGLMLAFEDQSRGEPLYPRRRDVGQLTAWRMQGMEMPMRSRESRR